MSQFFLKIYRFSALFAWCVYRSAVSILFTSKPGWEGVTHGARLTSYWAKGIARIINLEIRVHGNPDNVRGGLIVSNHLSYLDIISHSSVFNVRFSPKSTLRSWPLLGRLISMNRPVWVDRTSRQSSKKTLEEFGETMLHGINLLVYPEGTTSDGKHGVLPFKSTSFEAVISANFPVFPILTFYRQKSEEQTVCWFGDMDFLPHVWSVIGLPCIVADIYILDQVVPEKIGRKEFSARINEMMSEKFKHLI